MCLEIFIVYEIIRIYLLVLYLFALKSLAFFVTKVYKESNNLHKLPKHTVVANFYFKNVGIFF